MVSLCCDAIPCPHSQFTSNQPTNDSHLEAESVAHGGPPKLPEALPRLHPFALLALAGHRGRAVARASGHVRGRVLHRGDLEVRKRVVGQEQEEEWVVVSIIVTMLTLKQTLKLIYSLSLGLLFSYLICDL